MTAISSYVHRHQSKNKNHSLIFKFFLTLLLLSQPRNLCWVLFIPGEHRRSLTNRLINDVWTQHMLSRSQKWNHYFKILYMIQLLQLITGRCLTFLYWIIISQLKELFFEAFFRQTAKLKAAVILWRPLIPTWYCWSQRFNTEVRTHRWYQRKFPVLVWIISVSYDFSSCM